MAAPVPELSRRDRAILHDLDRVRLLSGQQLERLHFAELATSNARGSARRRSLGRLEQLRLVTTLPRRVGGVRAGSAGLIYALDARAHRQRQLWDEQPVPGRVRRPWPIGWPFVNHSLDVTELYVRFREAERAGSLRLLRYDAEPGSWFDTSTGIIKPDALAAYQSAGWEQYRWIEVDRSTESLPTLRRKLVRYLELVQRGEPGPDGLLPLVVITVPDSRRLAAVRTLIGTLPAAPTDFLTAVCFADVLQPGRPPP